MYNNIMTKSPFCLVQNPPYSDQPYPIIIVASISHDSMTHPHDTRIGSGLFPSFVASKLKVNCPPQMLTSTCSGKNNDTLTKIQRTLSFQSSAHLVYYNHFVYFSGALQGHHGLLRQSGTIFDADQGVGTAVVQVSEQIAVGICWDII